VAAPEQPKTRPGRPFLVRVSHPEHPEAECVVGPFQSRREARSFLREAFSPVSRPLAAGGVEWPLGRVEQWAPIEISYGGASPDSLWRADPRLGLAEVA
jgi:hypothetical protein